MIMNPSTIKDVVIDGHSLTIESFVAVARFGAKVSVAKEALDAMQKSRDLAEKIASEKRVAYGITTGFGDFARVAVIDYRPAACRRRDGIGGRNGAQLDDRAIAGIGRPPQGRACGGE